MFDKQEVQFLEKMFTKVVKETTKDMVTKDMFEKAMKDVVTKDVLRGELDDVKREIRDEMHSVVNGAVAASERRMMKGMDQIAENTKEEILDGVADIIGDRILPQIDDHDVRITRLKHQTA